MNKKKLIIFMPSIEGGGVEKNLYIISDFLTSKIADISLITVSKKETNRFNKKIKFITPKSLYWSKVNKKIKYLVCLYLLLIEIIKNKKILVFCFQANIYCTLLCKFFGIKIVVRSNSSPSGWGKGFIKKFIFKNLLGLSDNIIVNSTDFKKELKTRFNLDSVCIYNPLNIKEIIYKSKKKLPFKFFTDNKKLKIVNVARFTDQKDHMSLLKAVKILKNKINLDVLIIGRGVNLDLMKSFINLNNLRKQVKIINFQNNPFPIINKSDVFVLTSRFEGLPNVLLESLALKKFIISTDCPTGPREILDGGKNGFLFKVGDYEDLSKKIILYNNNKKKLYKKIFNGHKRLDRFSFNKNLKKYYLILNKYL
jgi:glycosyltransferase involved in cell wall biosynthesis